MSTETETTQSEQQSTPKTNWGMMAKGALNIAKANATNLTEKASASDFAKSAQTVAKQARAVAGQGVEKAKKTAVDTTAQVIYTTTKDGNSTVKQRIENAKNSFSNAKDRVATTVSKRVAEIEEAKNPKPKKKWNIFGRN